MGTNRRYPRDPPPDAQRRHCWVLGTPYERGPWPGLILEWRRANGGEWMARVVYVPNTRQAQSIEAWFAAALLRPLEPSRLPRGEADFR
ncbi:hypothetical protein [Kribbella deserti]|uniref:Uncharacterized protein n=1 Tax=Kribbella deserti TaxID=1926257 RepID=A0ABV6QVA3_9ACTN